MRPEDIDALRACDGDELAFERLCRELGGIMWAEVRQVRVPGHDLDDLMQRARLGVHQATIAFDPARGIPFFAFARLVIRRRLLELLAAERRRVRAALNEAVSFEFVPSDAENMTLEDILPSPDAGPLEVALGRERLEVVREAVRGLSELERRALAGYMAGLTYEEIGPFKSVDNALQRARRKISEALDAA